MLIRQLKLQNFMSHKNTTLELPEKGIILVTGANGSGKSSLAESIAVAGWGKSLRGSSCFVVNEESRAEITASLNNQELTIARESSPKGKIKLDFKPCDTKYATVTKAQAGLQNHIGDFDTWRRCSIFSSQDASHFTLSSDAERKRLLESLLGLDRFDAALDACRRDKKELERNHTAHDRERLRIQTKIESAERRKDDLLTQRTTQTTQGTPQVTGDDLSALQTRLDETQAAAQKLRESAYSVRESMSVEENNIRHARNRISTIEVDQCPTCGQAIDESYAENIREHENQSIETGRERLRTGKKKYDDLSAELENTQQTLREINGELATMQELKRRQETQQTLRQHLESEIKNLESEIDGLKKELKAKDRTLDELSFEIALQTNIESVLGTKGVRAHILTNALRALEITANKWLREISDGEYSLRVSPYTEKKTGGVKEAIAIHVDGIAGGHGYQGASGGQRRRIDVALLLALAELAQASSQYKGGTIFFDEVFDSLDASGVASVSKVIGQLGQRMPVVIISHSASLVDGLQADLHYHIDHGAVT